MQSTERHVEVDVKPEFLPDESDPMRGMWMYAYHVRITNRGKETVQLRNRHWIITDANGRTEEVRGPGVVGQQPVLRPGEHFEYTSGCPLPTAMGTMHGTYEMVTSTGERFDAPIPPFTLAEPYSVN